MDRLFGMSWRIGVRAYEHHLDDALWIRAAEGIDVPPDPLVPGPLDADVPAAQPPGDHLGEQWRRWWRSLVRTPGLTDGPDGPELRDVLARRRDEAHAWHVARSAAGAARFDPARRAGAGGDVVREVERATGRPVRPFEVDILLIPVRDDVIRRVSQGRYLVPERVYDSRRWPVWLRDLVLRIG